MRFDVGEKHKYVFELYAFAGGFVNLRLAIVLAF
jgi:hypothetical protein